MSQTRVLLKVSEPEEMKAELRMTEIRVVRAQKVHSKTSSKVRRFIHEDERNKYTRKEPTCAALSVFQALDPKTQLKMACAAFEYLVHIIVKFQSSLELCLNSCRKVLYWILLKIELLNFTEFQNLLNFTDISVIPIDISNLVNSFTWILQIEFLEIDLLDF